MNLIDQLNSLRLELRALEQNLQALETYILTRDKELLALIQTLIQGKQ
jgi:hypothetical protein